MAKKVLCSSHVPWIPDRPSSGSLVMLTAIGCASSKVNCLASTASRRRDLRRTRGDQRVHCASMLKVDASDLALTREALYRTLSLERAARGNAAAAPPSATSNSRRPRVTAIRPSRARCAEGTIPRRERAVPNNAWPLSSGARGGSCKSEMLFGTLRALAPCLAASSREAQAHRRAEVRLRNHRVDRAPHRNRGRDRGRELRERVWQHGRVQHQQDGGDPLG